MADRVPAGLDVRDRAADAALEPGRSTHRLLRRPGPGTYPGVRNAVLARVSLQDLAAMAKFLEPVVLNERMVLQERKKPPEYVYFVESGLVSLRIVAAGSILETAVIGYQGAVGASFFTGGHLSTLEAVALFPGSGHRIGVEDLRRMMNERPEIQGNLFQYAQALALHCAQTGLCAVRHRREERLASWLCLASDAAGTHVLPVTHEYLSSVLGLRRATVTETLIRFEEQGLIRKMRGVLHIDERSDLERRACGCYKLVSEAYSSSGP